ncbi:hypothetical protein GO496_24610 [Acidovorax citrulli]|nr:hypothetical protein [Paracidovorax citrulli]
MALYNREGKMNADQLLDAMARAVEMAKPAQEYCIAATRDYWWTVCMTKAEWSGWVQAVGSILALAVAIAAPLIVECFQRCKERRAELAAADLSIRFHTSIFETNEGMLRAATGHLPETGKSPRADAERQVFGSIDALRAVPYDEIKVIALIDEVLARDLVDFHCELESLRGVLARNPARMEPLAKNAGLLSEKKLTAITGRIRDRTINY